jgi:hypothetical protein
MLLSESFVRKKKEIEPQWKQNDCKLKDVNLFIFLTLKIIIRIIIISAVNFDVQVQEQLVLQTINPLPV